MHNQLWHAYKSYIELDFSVLDSGNGRGAVSVFWPVHDGIVGTGGEVSVDNRFTFRGGGVGTRSCTDRLDCMDNPLTRLLLFDTFLSNVDRSVVDPFADGKMIVRRTMAPPGFACESAISRTRRGAGTGEPAYCRCDGFLPRSAACSTMTSGIEATKREASSPSACGPRRDFAASELFRVRVPPNVMSELLCSFGCDRAKISFRSA